MSQIPRLYVGAAELAEQQVIQLDDKQSHYLVRVLRLREGKQVKLLGLAGEWLAEIEHADKKQASLRIIKQLRPYRASPDIWLCFAPVKNEKIDFLARRAVELGASLLWPVQTDFTQASRINMERLEANMTEAAEQCSRMDVPDLHEYSGLQAMLDGWDSQRQLFYADESGQGEPLHQLLSGLKNLPKSAILVGPEGGFSEGERALLRSKDFITPCTLGPRILRAETAVLAGLAHLSAWVGDGELKPVFVAE